MSHDEGENGWSLVRAIQDFFAELWSLILFNWLMPRRNHVPTDEEQYDTGVKSVAKIKIVPIMILNDPHRSV
jgi:hypothetical protein